MQVKLYDQTGEIVGDVELSDKFFGLKINHDIIKQSLDAHMANSRQVLAHTKDRSEVRGGGKKPWRQKGTGRARHASIRSPIWVGGGVAFGPTKDRNFSKKINKKVKSLALKMVLSSKIQDQELLMLNSFDLPEIKTKQAAAALSKISDRLEGYRKGKKKNDTVLMVTGENDKVTYRACRNLPFVEVLSVKNLNISELLNHKYLVLFKDAVPVIEKTF